MKYFQSGLTERERKMFDLVSVQVPLEDLQQASQMLVQALVIREKYMQNSRQSFPSITSRFLRGADKVSHSEVDEVIHDDRKPIAGMFLRYVLSTLDSC